VPSFMRGKLGHCPRIAVNLIWGSHVRRVEHLKKVAVYLLLLIAGCASLPTDVPRMESHTLTDTADTALGRGVAAWSETQEGKSGFYPLPTGLDALGARLALIDHAERSIDTQYFLIKKDSAGLIFGGKLVEAADRGVRVRFLLDDVFTTARDEDLLLLDYHPNVEVRLFNPVARGGIHAVNFLKDFERANRRMHNKSFTVDNQVTVVGGRNIAEEYFQLQTDSEFVDFDMLGVRSCCWRSTASAATSISGRSTRRSSRTCWIAKPCSIQPMQRSSRTIRTSC